MDTALPIAPPQAPQNQALKKTLVIALIAVLLLVLIGTLTWSFLQPTVDANSLTPDPKVNRAIFMADHNGRIFRGPMQPGMVPRGRVVNQAVEVADSVERQPGRITITQAGATAEVSRRRGAAGQVDVVLGYNGSDLPEQRMWLQLRNRMLLGRGPNLDPALTEQQLATLRDLAPNPALVNAPNVTDRIAELTRPLLTSRPGTTQPAGPVVLRNNEQLDTELLNAMRQLTAEQRQTLKDDFTRRANAVKAVLTPQQMAQVQLYFQGRL
ncbi:MAG: hypothetical protein QM770_06670 [Tepidisphaeraceae bacterium]